MLGNIGVWQEMFFLGYKIGRIAAGSPNTVCCNENVYCKLFTQTMRSTSKALWHSAVQPETIWEREPFSKDTLQFIIIHCTSRGGVVESMFQSMQTIMANSGFHLVMAVVTYKCQLKCIYCYVFKYLYSPSPPEGFQSNIQVQYEPL